MVITMVTESMVIHKSCIFHQKKCYELLLLYTFLLSKPESVLAFDWNVRPSFSLSEVFSDNLELSDTAKQSGFITEFAPGISLYGNSPWSNFNLNYRMQGLYNAAGSQSVDINHQLQMNSLYQAVRNTLFLQTSSSISQQNTSNSFIATDNLTGNSDRADVKNYTISPYWTPNFGQYASGLVKFEYQKTTFDQTSGSDTSLAISDSNSFLYQARLSSGSKFNQVRWNLNYSAQDQERESDDDVHFEQLQGDTRYYINRKFNVFALAGYENNDYQTTQNDPNNGVFYTFGGQWNPSQWYSLEAGYGNNRHITMSITPSTNFTSNVTFRNKEVGLNSGNSWDANLNYRAKQANVGFKYFQETTTVQQVLTQQRIFTQEDEFGNVVLDPVTQQPELFILNQPNYVDDVIVRKRGNISFGFNTGKSFYNASVYNERRTYEQSTEEDNIYGASGSWQWQFAPRVNLYLQPTWQSTENDTNGNDRYDVALGLTRSIPINLGRPLLMNTRIEYRHIDQMSDDADLDYTENRATANFAVQF